MQPAFLTSYRSFRAQGATASDAHAAADVQRRHGGTYRLPSGMSWADVAASRAKYGTRRRMLPLAAAHGVCGWGVPTPRQLGAIDPHAIGTLYRRTNDADAMAYEARRAGDYVQAAQWEREADEYAHAFQWARHAAHTDCVRNGAAPCPWAGQ